VRDVQRNLPTRRGASGLVGVGANAEIACIPPAAASAPRGRGRIGTTDAHPEPAASGVTTKGRPPRLGGVRSVRDDHVYWDAMEKVRAGICHLDDVLSRSVATGSTPGPKWMFAGSASTPSQSRSAAVLSAFLVFGVVRATRVAGVYFLIDSRRGRYSRSRRLRRKVSASGEVTQHDRHLRIEGGPSS
jgi:hypothetical protein